MTRQVVGVDVTAHKEERNVTETKKRSKLRVCYYVELVVGSPWENHTRLGFSGSFQALMQLHREFVRLYSEKYREPQSRLWSGRDSFLSSSPSTSRLSMSSTSKGSPTSFSSLVRHTFGLKKGNTTSNEFAEEKEATSKLYIRQDHLHHQYPSAFETPGIVPFPAQNKILMHLESGEAKDDGKIEDRNAALFEYYSRLFSSDDRELYLDFVYQHAQKCANKNKSQVPAEDEVEQIPSLKSSSGFLKLLRRPNTVGVGHSKHVEFSEPVCVRARGKWRGRWRKHRSSSHHAS